MNHGDEPVRWDESNCPIDELWPDDQSEQRPVLWPVPVERHQYCTWSTVVTLAPNTSHTFNVPIVAGLHEGDTGNVVPSPPGRTFYSARNLLSGDRYELPVRITPPATPPITVDHPTAVTTQTNTQHWVNFTMTNHLPFAVYFTSLGPCGESATCYNMHPDDPHDLRIPPYANGGAPLWATQYLLGANETRGDRAGFHATTDLDYIELGSPAMPPGVYYVFWDGDKVKFTVTP
jgi:hypothetical protein